MTKKLLFLVPALVLLVAGCGSKDSSETTGSTDSTTTSTGATGGANNTTSGTQPNTTSQLPGGATANGMQAKTGGHFINPSGEGNLAGQVGAKSGGGK